MTMELIETKTLGTAAASIEFTSIPQDGTDLLLTVSARSARAANQDEINFKLNSSTTNYSYRQLFGGAGSGAISTGSAGGTPAYMFSGIVPAANNTTNTFGNILIYLTNYAGATNKSISIDSVSENNAATWFQLDLVAGLWSNTSAITSVTFASTNSANFVAGSTISLYKITKGSDGIVTTS